MPFQLNKLIPTNSISLNTIVAIINTTVAVFALMIAIWSIRQQVSRDEESNKQFQKNLDIQEMQHNESVQIFNEQKEILNKYDKGAQLMLKELKTQAEISKLQYQNQIELERPKIYFTYEIYHSIQNDRDFIHRNNEGSDAVFFIPEVRINIYNSGRRTALDLKLKTHFISLNTINFMILHPTGLNELKGDMKTFRNCYPMISNKDIDEFILLISFQYKDELTQEVIKKTERIRIIRYNENEYSTFALDDQEKIDLVDSIINDESRGIYHTEVSEKYIKAHYLY